MSDAVVIAVHINKGGGGKTTTASMIGACLSLRDYRVLLIDTDPQKNLTAEFRLKNEEAKPENKHRNVFNFIVDSDKDDFDPREYVMKTVFKNILMVPACEQSGYLNRELDLKEFDKTDYLKNAIEPLKSEYDFIIIDAGLSVTDTMSYNTYQAADYVLIPFLPKPKTREIIPNTWKHFVKNKRRNKGLECGIAFVNVTKNRVSDRTQMNAIRKSFTDRCKIYDTLVHSDAELNKAEEFRVPINIFAPEARVSQEAHELTDELILHLSELFPEKLRAIRLWNDLEVAEDQELGEENFNV